MALLEIKDLQKTYSTKLGLVQCKALRGVSFSVEAGEFVAIMGASGSGKTTLLNLIASLDKPTSGSVQLDGRDFCKIPDSALSAFRRDHLGFVFQDFNLLDTFSLRDNILLPLVLSGCGLSEMEQRLTPVARRLGIEQLLDKYPYEVSGGEKQRAAVARAVITLPKLILADEPTGALDSRASENLMRILGDLNSTGNTILMVTHSSWAASFAKRVLFIRDGLLFSALTREADESRQKFSARIDAALSAMSDGGETA